MLQVIAILILLFGALVPPMLFPNENQILVGFIGAPFILFGMVLLLIASFKPQRLEDKDRDKNDGPKGGGGP